MASRIGSRRRFVEYIAEHRRKRAAGEFKPSKVAQGGNARQAARHRSFLALFGQFLELMGEHRYALGFALATLSVSTVLALIPPAATKIAVDYVLSGQPLPDAWLRLGLPTDRRRLLLLTAVGVVAVTFVENLVHLWGRWFATKTTKRVQLSVRRKVFDHAVRLPLHRVYQLKSGGVASILREDAGGVGELIFSMIYNPWRAVLQLFGSLIVLAWVDWRLLLGTLLLIPLVFGSHRTWISRIRPLSRDVRKQRQEIDGHSTEAFGGMRVVRAFHRERSEENRFVFGNHLMGRQELNVWWWARGVELVWELSIPTASAALLYYGGSQVLDGKLSLGDLMMFLIYLAMLLSPLAVLANSATQLQSDMAGLDRVLDLLDEPLEMPAAPHAVAVRKESIRGRVSVRDVSFRYPAGDEMVLRGVSFDAEPGQMIALVGPSGAGKTTLCNLIARFYDPTEGSLQIDGKDLRDLDVDSYRSLLGIVEQEIFLFDGTLAENIAYANRHASIDEIVRAAQIANADSFIRTFPAGYDTVIGERGVRLSGGQRQRVAIARAVLADPKLLILDEATSNLDTESERLIQESLRSLMRGRTSFVIAHRLSTIMHADKIVVLQDGRIVEIGSHEELVARGGRYAQMVHLQTSSIGELVVVENPNRPDRSTHDAQSAASTDDR